MPFEDDIDPLLKGVGPLGSLLHEPPVHLHGEPWQAPAPLMVYSPRLTGVEEAHAPLHFYLEATPKEVPLPGLTSSVSSAAIGQELALVAECPQATPLFLPQIEFISPAQMPLEDMHALLLAHTLLAV
ncbi:hypothetical protein [Desulfovibrio cuneatus]|uniref:hypothetical protein n=1 Tax=Desulfovibrio cuneatus TaxID=159728 RepID=UPI00040238D6|nr:hypothetical protein [Desulfovibrio cuneatus]